MAKRSRALVMKVMECVCILLGSKPDWDSAKKVLGDVNLLERLGNYDKDNIAPRIVKQLIVFYDDPEFALEVVEKVSLACRSLCLRCRAMKVYNEVAQVVEPKRQLVADATASLNAEKAKLAKVEAELAEVVAKVDKLQATCDATQAEKKQLQEAADTTARRLVTADKLTSGLADEQVRWTATAETLRVQLGGLTGSVFCPGCICRVCWAVYLRVQAATPRFVRFVAMRRAYGRRQRWVIRSTL